MYVCMCVRSWFCVLDAFLNKLTDMCFIIIQWLITRVATLLQYKRNSLKIHNVTYKWNCEAFISLALCCDCVKLSLMGGGQIISQRNLHFYFPTAIYAPNDQLTDSFYSPKLSDCRAVFVLRTCRTLLIGTHISVSKSCHHHQLFANDMAAQIISKSINMFFI